MSGERMPRFGKTLDELRRIGTESEISRDALLWRQGDTGDEVVVLLDGLFDIVRASPDGEPVLIRTVNAAAILGEMAAMDGRARSAAARASPASRALPVPGDARFVVLLYGASQDDAARLAQRLRERVEATPFKGASVLPGGRLAVSLGAATCPVDGSRADTLFESAEVALNRERVQRGGQA